MLDRKKLQQQAEESLKEKQPFNPNPYTVRFTVAKPESHSFEQPALWSATKLKSAIDYWRKGGHFNIDHYYKVLEAKSIGAIIEY